MGKAKAPPKGRVKVKCGGCGKPLDVPARDYWAEAEYAEKFKEKPRPWFHNMKCMDRVRTPQGRGRKPRSEGLTSTEVS